jgi:hypothetical protein
MSFNMATYIMREQFQVKGTIVHVRSLSKRLLFFNLWLDKENRCVEVIAKAGVYVSAIEDTMAILALKKQLHLGDEVLCMGEFEEETSSGVPSFLVHSMTCISLWRASNPTVEFQVSEKMQGVLMQSRPKKTVDILSESPSWSPCKFFINTGRCSRGELCPYAHPVSADGKPDKAALAVWLKDRTAQRKERAGEMGYNVFNQEEMGHEFTTAAEKGQRAILLAKWIVDTFGKEKLNAGSGVIDVGGGRGGLTFELQVIHGVKVTLIDTRPFKLTRRQHKILDQGAGGTMDAEEEGGMFDPLVLMVKERKEKDPKSAPSSTEIQVMEGRFHQIQAIFSSDLWQQPSPIASLLCNASLVVGLHPDQATNGVLDFAMEANKPFVIVPCCVFPTMFQRHLSNGEQVLTTQQLVEWIRVKGAASVTALPFSGANTVCYKLGNS